MSTAHKFTVLPCAVGL